MKGKLEIAKRLRVLADEMDQLSVDMDYYGGLANWAMHGREMAGAGRIAREWADNIERDEVRSVVGNDDAIPESDCHRCIHRRAIPGSSHIACAKPDPGMTGTVYSIKNGWFNYPESFDPIWRSKECVNFVLDAEVADE
jgi:hypothetical protein